jgi:hypothetical protein
MTRLDYLKEKENQYTTIKEEHLKNYRFIHKLTEEYSEWEIRTIREILSEGRDRGVFRFKDIEATSKAIYFGLKGLEYPWTIDLEGHDIERSANRLIDILLSGISAVKA